MKQRLILMMALMACAIGVTAGDFEVDGIHYDVVGHGAVEIAPGGNYSGDFVIPTHVTYSGVEYTVTGIGDNAFQDRDVNTVNIPNTVTRIGELAFMTTPLKEVTIPESVIAIGDGAFSDCRSLAAIKGKFATEDNNALIVDSVLVALASNPSIQKYTTPDSVTRIGHHTFYGNPYLRIVNIRNSVETIGHHAFSHCESLTDVIMANSVTELGEAAFQDCVNLKKVSLSYALTAIKTQTFERDESLTSITIPSSVKAIEAGAFYSSGLTSITIPSDVKEISWATFAHCYNLQSVTLPEGLTHIDGQAFISCISLKEITIPNTVTSIEETAFQSCDALRTFKGNFVSPDNTYMMVGNLLMRVFPDAKLTTFTVPDNVTTIAPDAFKYCTDLTTVEFPESVTVICEDAFDGCTSLDSITLPKYITEIRAHTFRGCHSLKSITLPKNLKVIQGDSFVDCDSLESIEFPLGLEGIDGGAFQNCVALTSITLPLTVRSISGSSFEGCTSLSAFYGKFASDDHRSLIIDDTIISVAYGGLTTYTVPEGIKHIGEYCFAHGAGDLRTIKLPSTLETVSLLSFCGLTNLTSIELPNSIYKICPNAFRDTGISAVTLPVTMAILENDIFSGAPLQSVTLESEDPWSISIREYDPFGGTDVKENGTLYVPFGTKDLYSGHWYWSQFNNIVETQITGVNHFVGEDTKVTLDEVTLVPVTMVNEANVFGMQFDVVLPDGIALAQNEYGNYYLESSDRFADYNVMAQDIWGGVRYVVISESNTKVAGHDGVLFSLPVIATGAPRQADILISNIRLSENTYRDIKVAPMMLTPEVKQAYTLGDVNNDGEITVTDVTLVVAYVLGNTPPDTIWDAADANCDGEISVTDVTIVVSFVLGQQPTAPSRAMTIDSGVSGAEHSELALNDNGTVELTVSDLSAYTSAQFDLILNEGAAVSGISLRGDQGHVVTYRDNGDGTVRVLAYSPSNNDFAADAAFEIALESMGSVNMTVAGIRLAQVCGNAVSEVDAEGCSAHFDLSGMGDSMPSGLSVSTIAGGVVINATDACDITLYDTLGRGYSHTLSAGANRIALPKGVYMLGSRKLVIR